MSIEEQQLHTLINLIGRKLNGALNEAEEADLKNWIAENEENKALFEQLSDPEYRKTQLKTMMGFTEEEIALKSFMAKRSSEAAGSKIGIRKLIIVRISMAAAVLLVAGLSVFFYKSYYTTPRTEAGKTTQIVNHDIKPGGNKAYLTLANGQRVSLTDAANGAVAKEEGVEISKTADGQVIYKASALNYSNALNTIETPRGGQYQVRLPDGSKVWLNAASKLIYPVSFKGRERREVSLTGEAYFEIFKNKLQPFVVKSKNQEVTVLGTHFNVNTYADEPGNKTTLLEGSVKINNTVLKPGQQAILISNQINVKEVNTTEIVAWKNGDFIFKTQDFKTIMRQIARWYDVDIIYDPLAPNDVPLGGQISRSKNISAILKIIEATGDVHFKIEGRRVIITK